MKYFSDEAILKQQIEDTTSRYGEDVLAINLIIDKNYTTYDGECVLYLSYPELKVIVERMEAIMAVEARKSAIQKLRDCGIYYGDRHGE